MADPGLEPWSPKFHTSLLSASPFNSYPTTRQIMGEIFVKVICPRRSRASVGIVLRAPLPLAMCWDSPLISTCPLRTYGTSASALCQLCAWTQHLLPGERSFNLGDLQRHEVALCFLVQTVCIGGRRGCHSMAGESRLWRCCPIPARTGRQGCGMGVALTSHPAHWPEELNCTERRRV